MSDTELCRKYSFVKGDSALEKLFDEKTYTHINTRKERKEYRKELMNKLRARHYVNWDYYDNALGLRDNLSPFELSSAEKGVLAFSELICTGKVIDLRDRPDTGCKNYKSTYFIRIDEVVFSLYDIDRGDTIIYKAQSGIVGESCREGGSIMHVSVSGTADFEKGGEYLFALSNVDYFVSAISINQIGSRYNDLICNSFFSGNSAGILKYDFEMIPEIKDFLGEFYGF